MPTPKLIGHKRIRDSLWRMVAERRLPQTMLFCGMRGIGKCTLARHLAAGINCQSGPGQPCGDCSPCRRILATDPSAEQFLKQIEERKKMTAAKRKQMPLVVAIHPDVLIFPPDGPSQLIAIDQARYLREQARLAPAEGRQRVFILTHADKATEPASNALLKTLEEPVPSLTLILTSENPHHLLPTIRSRAIPFHFSPLTKDQMRRFLETHGEIPPDRRDLAASWSEGSPGAALRLDMKEFRARREAMLAVIETGLRRGQFGKLSGQLAALGRGDASRIERLAAMLWSLLRDLTRIRFADGRDMVHSDIATTLEPLAKQITVEWLQRAVSQLQEVESLERYNVQRQIALEAYALGLRT